MKMRLIYKFSIVYAFLAFLLCLSAPSQAQIGGKQRGPAKKNGVAKKDTTESWKDKITFGGNAGAQIGNVTMIEIAPLIGYKIKPDLVVGLGPSYIYRNFITTTDEYGNFDYYKYGNSVIGGRIFGQYSMFNFLVLRAEYQDLRIPSLRVPLVGYSSPQEGYIQHRWVSAFPVGGGIYQKIGSRSTAVLLFMYDLNYDPRYSFNSSPLSISAGFLF